MSNDVFKVRRLDDRAVHEIFMRAAEASSTAASVEGLKGAEVKVTPEFLGVSVLGRLDFEDSEPKAGHYTIKTAQLNLQMC